jgi:hypothetical protein
VRSLITGGILTLGAIAVFVARRTSGDDVARTAALAAVIAGGLAVAWVERGLDVPWWRAGVPRTRRFWIVALAIIASFAVVLASPALASALYVAPIGLRDVAIAIAVAFAAIAWRGVAPGMQGIRA